MKTYLANLWWMVRAYVDGISGRTTRLEESQIITAQYGHEAQILSGIYNDVG